MVPGTSKSIRRVQPFCPTRPGQCQGVKALRASMFSLRPSPPSPYITPTSHPHHTTFDQCLQATSHPVAPSHPLCPSHPTLTPAPAVIRTNPDQSEVIRSRASSSLPFPLSVLFGLVWCSLVLFGPKIIFRGGPRVPPDNSGWPSLHNRQKSVGRRTTRGSRDIRH